MEKKTSTSPPFLGNLWSTLLPILMALGIPGATAAAFLTRHIWLCVIIGLAYEIGLLIFGFAGKVWQRLEDLWVERTAGWVDRRTQSISSGYKKKYYDYLYYQHRDFDVRGLSFRGAYKLELDQIFVDLSINTTTMEKATVSSIPQTLRERSHAIWDFLASVPLREQHFAIIGPPGSGKTTLLKHIVLIMISHHQVHAQSEQAHIPQKLPILLFLRDHAQAIDKASNGHSPFTLIDAIHNHLKKWEQPEPPVGWFQQQLEQGQCLVMLDGLDEVAELDIRKNVVDWVERQMKACHRNRFIVTSRPFGYRSNPLYNVATLEVQPFTPAQVEQFVHKWYLANEIMSKQKDDPGVRMMAKAGARELLQQLRSKPNLFALTVNPLLLTMITTIHYNGGKLPEKRVTLYAEICSVFLGRRQQARGVELPLTHEQIQMVLEPLAYHMMTSNTREITLDEAKTIIQEPLSGVDAQLTSEAFLQLVENASGLLFERENGVYSFAHLTFQEYLTATYIQTKNLGDILVTQTMDSWWQETIRLYCAMADATPIISVCLENSHPSAVALELAIECDKEARNVEPSLRKRLNTVIEQGKEDPDPERQHVVAEALLARRLRNMVHLKDETYVDTSLITCTEYQLFLDEQHKRGKYLQPIHWTSYHFLPGQGNAPILGVHSSDAKAFCEWLTIRKPGWRYRLPAAGELEGEGIHEKLPRETGYWLEDGQGFTWAGQTPKLPSNVKQEIRDNLFNDLILAIIIDLEHILDRAIAITIDLDFDLAITIDRIRTINRIPIIDSQSAVDRIETIRHKLARAIVLDLQLASSYKKKTEQGQANIDAAINTYIDLVILEKRIKGELPACEGILIVKERTV